MIDKKFYSHLWFLILYVPFVFIIKEFLPENIARENGPIENFQLILLVIGVYFCYQSLKNLHYKPINIFGRLVLFFMH